MQLHVLDEGRIEMVPVWGFLGYYETVFENGATDTHYQNDNRLLTINAINGSIINGDLGY